MTAHILIVEDDPVLRRGLSDSLVAEGYRVSVAVDGREARALLAGSDPMAVDGVVLDIMLPGPSGLEVLRAFRERDRETPVLLLSARGEEHDKVMGLELGADDYVTKPFGKRELLARVKALLRRRPGARGPGASADGDAPRFTIGSAEVDVGAFTVQRDGAAHPLSPKEAGMLALLFQRQGRAVARADFLREVWDDDRCVGNRTVDTHMLNLRQKVEPDPKAPKHLITVHGVGYRLDL